MMMASSKSTNGYLFLNDFDACGYLGDIYRLGKHGVRVKGVRYYRQGAEHDDKDCQRFLGYCYLTGTGVTQSLPEANIWFRKLSSKVIKCPCYTWPSPYWRIATCTSAAKRTRILDLLLRSESGGFDYDIEAIRLLRLGEACLKFADNTSYDC